MLRMLLTVALILSSPLQAIASGGDGSDAADQAVIEHVLELSAGVTATDGQCCDEVNLSESRPSACKTDCKAVMSAHDLVPYRAPPDHGRHYLAPNTSFDSPVDLRPPIS